MATDVTWLGTTDTKWSTVSNWSDGAVPAASDNVSIPAGSPNIDGGLDQSAVALGNVYVEKGYTGVIGDLSTDPSTCLKLNCDKLVIDGKCTAYLDLKHGPPEIDVTITDSAFPQTGKYGIYLIGDGLSDLDIRGGYVGIATFLENTMAVADLRIGGSANVTSGRFSTITNISNRSGNYRHLSENATSTVGMDNGVAMFDYVNGGTFTQRGGMMLINDWSGTVNLVVEGGITDLTQGGTARTLNALTVDPGGQCWIDPSIVTVTTKNDPTVPAKIGVARLSGAITIR